ncbi:MAG TPA: valine--tRNA ligase [Acidobacteriaceae bacterium]|nr:valine--tRNA ligase [Acidobacteriaceae bacterium]
MPRDLPKAYDPAAIEDRWAAYWVDEKLFDQPHAEDPSTTPVFSVLLPPPNVTGRLHMGHMLEHTEIDILTRWRRMCGDLALWIPGTDHAGIATQLMVERQLAEEHKTRQQLGREAFIERVWQWKQHYGAAILDQMRRLGTSVDWSREYFTMDGPRSTAVREAFVRLHEQGLIYRGAYIVNWCPRCQTAISDLEVIHEEQQGKLWEIRYPIVDEEGFVTVATTRPETMLGDVAVAVNPEDERYTHLHGKMLRLPLTGREIPIITDSWVSREFGTGAVKVTPAHDPNDFSLGQRHNLPSITVLDETAHMNAQAGKYAGLDRYKARHQVLEDLEAEHLLAGVREHVNSIGKCERCKTVSEPLLSTQWFIRIQPLADQAIAAVEQGHIRFTPEQSTKTYFEWMRNIHDWCISRQLWWGHRIPAWHCAACGKITVSRTTPEVCQHCKSGRIEQEKDVLDTWFSSGLLPCSSLGWPEHTPDLDAFYPTEQLVTGFDILFFWVARMIMLGCHFMLEEPMPDGSKRTLKDAVPFREVYIHALVRDADRQKMSKTKGNVIDPIQIVERFGTDAVRFTLAAMASPGTDIAFSEDRTDGYRAFANKIWNAARFIFMQMERAAEAGIVCDLKKLETGQTLEARWIVSRLHRTAGEMNQALKEYRFHEAANTIYRFFWGDFCDWYLEVVKLRLPDRAALGTLLTVFESALRLLSPFMPFITEEIWHALYENHPPAKSIALSRYPQAQADLLDDDAEQQMSRIQDLIVAVRDMRRQLGVEEKATVPILLRVASAERAGIEQNQEIVGRLARVSGIEFVQTMPEGTAVRSAPGFDVAVIYERTIDVAVECERLSKELARFEKEVSNADRQLSNEGFLAKAPPNVVEGLRRRAAELGVLIPKTRAALDSLNCT